MTKTHKELYPSQYSHAHCGKTASKDGRELGVIVRVVDTAFGDVAIFGDDDETEYHALLKDLQIQGEPVIEKAPSRWPAVNAFGYEVDYDAILEAVKKYAADNYDLGWDIVVETFTDEEIIEALGAARSGPGAIRKLQELVTNFADHATEITNA